MVAWGEPRKTLREVLERLADDAELITCLRGRALRSTTRPCAGWSTGEVELELEVGGQESYWWLLSAE